MMKLYKGFYVFFLAVCLPVAVSALDVPPMAGRVNDTAGIFPSPKEKELELSLASLEKNTAGPVVVLTIPSLQGEALEDYAVRVSDQWQLGREGNDHSVLLLVSLKERKIRIEVGSGLEESLTDEKTSSIIRYGMIPYFQKGDYTTGILTGVRAVGGVIRGDEDISFQELERSHFFETFRSVPINFIIILVVILLNTFGRMGRRGGLFRMLFRGNLLRHVSRRGSGSGGRGWSSDGGFPGGGGGFGGGGASGGW